MKTYVCGFMKDDYGRVALVRKNKPAWQAGKLNGIGGGIEPNESPFAAMCREFREKTEIVRDHWQQFAIVSGPDFAVHFFKANVGHLPELPAHNDIGAALEVHPHRHVLARPDKIQNLNWLLPLAFESSDRVFVSVAHADDGALPVAANDNNVWRLVTPAARMSEHQQHMRRMAETAIANAEGVIEFQIEQRMRNALVDSVADQISQAYQLAAAT